MFFQCSSALVVCVEDSGRSSTLYMLNSATKSSVVESLCRMLGKCFTWNRMLAHDAEVTSPTFAVFSIESLSANLFNKYLAAALKNILTAL